MTKRCTDIGALLPSFQPFVRALVSELEADFRPVINETLRSQERAAMLSIDPDGDGPRKAPGVKDSMHCHGAAVDLRCGDHDWFCHKHDCSFFEALGAAATRLGLYWGGHFGDTPHVQAVPPTPAAQNKLRALKTWEKKDAFVRSRLPKVVP